MPLNGKHTRRSWPYIALLILADLLLCISFIKTAPIGLDEPFSIFHAQKSLPDLFAIFTQENNPPLHFVFLHFWEKLFGIGPVSVRSLSLLFSLLTIPVVWRIGEKFFNRSTALIACLLFLLSDFHHFHALEARTYSLLVLEFSILTFLLLKIISEGKNVPLRTWIFLALINVSIFYTHYLFVLLLPAEIVVALLFLRRIRIPHALIGAGIFSALILPWIPVLLKRTESVETSGTWLAHAQWTELYGLINKFLNDRWVLATLVCLLILLIIIQRRYFFERILAARERLTVLLLLFALPYLSCFVLSVAGGPSLFYDRYLFLLTVPLFTGIAFLMSGKQTYTRTFAVVFLLVFSAFFELVPDNHRDADQLAAFVRENGSKPIVIAPEYYDLNFLYYYNRKQFENPNLRKDEAKSGIYGVVSLDSLLSLKPDSFTLIDANFAFTHPGANLTQHIRGKGYQLTKAQKFKGDYSVMVFSR